MENNTQYPELKRAVLAMLTQCDGAHSDDGKGFNKYDSRFVRDINSRSFWTHNMADAIHKLLRKYTVQLLELNLPYETIPAPDPNKTSARPVQTIKRAILRENRIVIEFRTADKEEWNTILEGVRGIPGRTFTKEKLWNAPLSEYAIETLKKLKFELDPAILSWKSESQKPLPEIQQEKGLSLFPFQIEGVRMLEKLNGRALLADQQRLGKTLQVIVWMKLHPELRPAIVVCPATAKINWDREIKKWLPGEKTKILKGRTASISNENIIIMNYDILSDYLDLLVDIEPKILIIDESQAVKNAKANRTRAVKYLGKGIPHIIATSGTPIVNRPGEFFTTLNLLNKDLFPNYFRFSQEYCAPKHNGFGWVYTGASNTEKLHKILKDSFMIRRTREEVMPQLPKKIRTVVPLEIDNRAEYEKAEEDIIRYIHEMEGEEKAHSASLAEALARFNRLKMLSVRGKMAQIVEWIQDFLENENKLIVFATHHETVDVIMEKFKTVAVKLDGRDSAAKKQISIDGFQKNPEIKLFVGNIIAAGSAINLSAASTSVFVELDWVPGNHDQAEDRPIDITKPAVPINAYYLVGVDTVEEKIAKLLDEKRKVLEAVLDGKEPEDSALLTMLIQKYKEG